MMDIWRFLNLPKILGIVTIILFALPMSSAFAATQVWYGQPGAVAPVQHTFTLDDVQGGFGDGYTEDDYENNPNILCGPGQVTDPCPNASEEPTSPVQLYGIDGTFGFNVFDFAGATGLTHDYDYAEGWVGEITNADGTGLMIGNAETKLFKSDAKRGTWCAGMGGTSVKCSSENYVVMENVLTCNEMNPWNLADLTAPYAQADLSDPNTDPVQVFNCADAILDNTLYEVVDGDITATELAADADGLPDLPANESTIRNDVAVSDDYAVTRKDDGKPLYRWGNLVKRPTDVRVYKSIPLPDAWKQGAVYPVTKAELKIKHWITNNPNDQIRAEDMENEGARGLKPSINESEDSAVWTSAYDCYAGDGSLIEAGTVLKNEAYADRLDPADPGYDASFPYPYSSDLKGGFTNAYYTTTDRDPFEWWYQDDNGVNYSFPDPNEASAAAMIATANVGGTPLILKSGPRWRLKAPKYGQDLPGVEIGVDAQDYATNPGARPGCLQTPITSGQIKYPRGEVVTTVINLLDWNPDEAPGPLATTAGWVDASSNANAIVADPNNHLEPYPDGSEPATGISVNGAPLTEDFDLVVYIKGDKKPTVIYDATLEVEWDDTAVGCVDPVYSDFNVDCISDVLIKNSTTTAFSYVRTTDGVAVPFTSSSLGVVSGIGYFDSDGLSDVLIKDGQDLSFVSTDGSVTAIVTLPVGSEVQGVGDFNNDGVSDVLVRNGEDISYIEADGTSTAIRSVTVDWAIEGVGDFDGDGFSDALVRRVNNTQVQYLEADGTLNWIKNVTTDWGIEGVGDFDGDGLSDALMRKVNGTQIVFLEADANLNFVRNLTTDWIIEGVGDYNGDGSSEAIIRRLNNTQVQYLDSDGTLNWVRNLSTGWIIQPE